MGGQGRAGDERDGYVTSDGLARGWTSELAAVSNRLLWFILREGGRERRSERELKSMATP